MTRKKIWQYKCSWCGKKGLSARHMLRHEQRCTLNPKRECGMCGLNGGGKPHTDLLVSMVPTREALGIAEDLKGDEWDAALLVAKLASIFPEVVTKLQQAAEGCPACILAAFRQQHIPLVLTGWDYKQARKDFFAEYNETRNDSGV